MKYGAVPDPQEAFALGNPFQQLLRPLSECLIPSIAYDAPLPLAAISSQVRNDSPIFFFHSCANVPLHVVALAGPACVSNLTPRDWISLIYVCAGEITLGQRGECRRVLPGNCLMVPAHATTWRSTEFSAVCVMISLAEASRVNRPMISASEAAGSLEWPPRRLLSLGSFHSPGRHSLIPALDGALRTLNDLLDGNRALIVHLGLEEYVCRLTALLLLPCLFDPYRDDFSCASDDQSLSQFRALLNYIDAHLDQPLTLALLQDRLHYSKRAVQYAFRRQLGCTATQWIRARRLDKAHAMLRHPGTEDTVAGIAQACGYRSMSLFSIEFQQRFYVKPSVLLRRYRYPENDGSPEERSSP